MDLQNLKYIKEVKTTQLWNAGYCSLYDFSKANSCQEAREEAVAIVSSACRGKEIRNKEKHYKKMLVEHGGKASEILSFIPIISHAVYPDMRENQFYRLCYDFEGYLETNLRNFYNFQEHDKTLNHDCKQFAVFKIKVPYMIVDHLRRHKLLEFALAENWQSNRSKHGVEYFENDEVKVEMFDITKDVTSSNVFSQNTGREIPVIMRKNDKVRQELLNKGEFGLRYVTGWIAGWVNDPLAWDNFLSVRTIKPSQNETIELAIEIEKLIKKHF